MKKVLLTLAVLALFLGKGITASGQTTAVEAFDKVAVSDSIANAMNQLEKAGRNIERGGKWIAYTPSDTISFYCKIYKKKRKEKTLLHVVKTTADSSVTEALYAEIKRRRRKSSVKLKHIDFNSTENSAQTYSTNQTTEELIIVFREELSTLFDYAHAN